MFSNKHNSVIVFFASIRTSVIVNIYYIIVETGLYLNQLNMCVHLRCLIYYYNKEFIVGVLNNIEIPMKGYIPCVLY